MNPNVFLLRKTLHSSDIDAAVSHLWFCLSGRSNKNYGIELGDGSVIDSEGLQDLKHLSQLIECQKETREENLWLENLSSEWVVNDKFPVFTTQLVSLLQSHGIDKEIQPINLRVAHLRCRNEECNTSYPPINEAILLEMIVFMRDQQFYKSEVVKDREIFKKEIVPRNLIPLQEKCHFCHATLSNPIKYLKMFLL